MNLSFNQKFFLKSVIEEGVDWVAGLEYYSHFIKGAKALIRRGLIRHEKPYTWYVTELGLATYIHLFGDQRRENHEGETAYEI